VRCGTPGYVAPEVINIKDMKTKYSSICDIYSLGLIYNIELEERENYLFCEIDMTLTSPACPVADSLLEQVRYVAMAVDEVDEAKVNLVFEPVWEPHMMSEEAKEVMGASGAAISW